MSEPITVTVVTQQSEPAGDLSLPTSVFGGPVRRALLHETVCMQLANRRAGTAGSKSRGEVRGGGSKPWRQKGTGRARAGSSRSPIWTGGATVFGPQPRDWSYRIPKSARRSALRSALTLRAREGKLIVLDRLEIEPAKTRVVAQMLERLEAPRALLLVAEPSETLQRAVRNLPTAKLLPVEGANVYDILRYPHLVTTRDAVEALERRLTR